MEELETLEIALRGGTITLCLMLTVKLARHEGSLTSKLGALFALGTAAYTIVSSPALLDAFSPLRAPIILLAQYNAVFLWWFVTSLFEDDFRLKPWRLAPFAIAAIGHLPGMLGLDAPWGFLGATLLQLNMLAMLTHAITLAVKDWSGDLVEERRQFRIAFTVIVGLTGIIVTAAERWDMIGDVPPVLFKIQAVALFTWTLLFAIWMNHTRPGLFHGAKPDAPEAVSAPVPQIPASERADLDRLNAKMAQGFYTGEGLTIGALAEDLGMPEHRLRVLINRHLGHRNFAAFLNSYRLADAKAALSDPDQARKQILTLALDLGYGSVGPFNRAFKQETGLTPTEFRRQALGQ